MPPATELITDRAGLAALAPQWNALLAESGADCIFLTWEWIDAWLDAVHPRAGVCTAVVRDGDGRPAAIAPLYRTSLRLLGVLEYPTLRVLGDVFSGGEYGDWIIRRGEEAEHARALLRALLGDRSWQCLWMPNVSGWSGAPQRVGRACGDEGLFVRRRERDFAAAALPESYDAYFASLSGNTRSTLRRQTKRLAAEGLELLRCARVDDVPRFLGWLFDLHQRRWQRDGASGSFERKPLMRRFYERFAPVAQARGWLRLYALRVGGRVCAVQYGYAYGGTYAQLQEGFDPEAPEGAGNVLRAMVIEDLIREGVRTYDFLGGFSEHKRRWRAELRAGHDLLMGRLSIRNRLLFGRSIWPTGRYLRPEKLGANV